MTKLFKHAMLCRVMFVVLAITVVGCSANQPARSGGVAGAARVPHEVIVDHGQEAYRIESRTDRVIAVLENGATLIVQRVQSPVVAVRAYCRTGGVYEGKWLGGGLSHLLEHLVAGGTNARRTEEQNRDLLQKIGNNSNAYTTTDSTSFFVNTTPDHTAEAIDLVTGWVMTAAITPAEYEREYEVVQRELEMGKGDPDSVFSDMTLANRYRVSPTRVPVIGYQEVIQGLSRDDVYSYYKLAYVPNNMVFVVAGDVDPEVAIAALRDNLKEFSPGRVFDHTLPEEPVVMHPRKVTAGFAGLSIAKLDLAYPSVRLDETDLHALDLLAAVMGDGETSLLTEQLRDEKELVSEVSASDWTPFWVKGSFSITMSLKPENIPAATAETLRLIRTLKATPLDTKLIDRAKNRLRIDQLRDTLTSEEIATRMAEDFLGTGDVDFTKEYIDAIQKVSPKELQNVAIKYLDPARLITTTLLPAQADGSAATRPAPATRPADSAITRTELPDGGVLLHKRVVGAPLVEVQVYAKGGLSSEEVANAGYGSIAMAMLDRGTATQDGDAINDFFDSIGSSFEASCERNYWTWQTSVLKDDFAATLPVFGDILNNPSFDKDELNANRPLFLQELRGRDAAWDEQALHFFTKAYFEAPKSPYRFAEWGSEDHVGKVTTADLKNFYNEVVLKAPRVMSIVGDVDAAAAEKLAARYLAGGDKLLPDARVPARPRSFAKSDHARIEVRKVALQKTSQALAGVVVGFDSHSVTGDSDSYAKTLADTVVSGYDYPTGYLFDILRGRGLVYDVHAVDYPGISAALPGTFYVFAGCQADKVDEVTNTIIETMARLQQGPPAIDNAWVERAKTMIVTANAIDSEAPASLATTIALAELNGLGYDAPANFGLRINALSTTDIVAFARTHLSTAFVAISTPKPGLVHQSEGVRQFTKFDPIVLAPKGVEHDKK